MAPWLILATGLVYAYVAAELYWTGKNGMALTFLGYFLGNVGLYMAAK